MSYAKVELGQVFELYNNYRCSGSYGDWLRYRKAIGLYRYWRKFKYPRARSK